MDREKTASDAVAGATSRITVDEFAESTFAAITKAIDRRPTRPGGIRGPIIFGIIYFPDGLPGDFGGNLPGSGGQPGR